MQIESFPLVLKKIQMELSQAVFGMEHYVRQSMIALMVRGHVLLEGPPGVAKTMFARALSICLGLQTHRLQCTPDLMPGDVIGTNIFDFKSQTFSLTKGPVFTEFLLIDEINRTPPKTQSSLLEAMQERSVSIDGTTHELSSLFTVFATQNPIEHEGTYPLPEAQLDRFLFHLKVDYPQPDMELQAVLAHCKTATMPDLSDVISPVLPGEQAIVSIQALPEHVRIEPDVAEYIVRLAHATREHEALSVGLSPRASIMLAAASRAAAVTEGREYVLPDDVKSLFLEGSRHRVVLAPGAEMEGLTVEDALHDVLTHVAVPR